MAELKQLIFFDFEMLCSDRGMPYEDMEAIRLGAVKYDIETEQISYFDRFIRPEQTDPLSDFCKELTGINDSDLVFAQNFASVFSDFLHWIGGVKRSRFYSWSSSDMSRLKVDANRHHLPETTIKKIEKRYIDFQAIFTRRVSKTNMSVENALSLYHLSFIGDKHNPMYDSYNTWRIYKHFIKDRLKTDLIMLKQFGFPELTDDQALKNVLKSDVASFISELDDMYPLKQVKKILKRLQRLVGKYENIVINRSGVFSQDMIQQIVLLNEFYQELLSSYQEHSQHASKVMILHQHMLQPVQPLIHSN